MSSCDLQEWLVTDGLGGFAMGTVGGIRTRRYHSLWTHALGSPTERFLILNGLEVGMITDDGRRARFFPQVYSDDYFVPTENVAFISFEANPYPKWRYRVFDEVEVVFSIQMERGKSGVRMDWVFSEAKKDWIFWVMPLISGRDFHALHHENAARNLEIIETLQVWKMQPYPDRPAYEMRSDGFFIRDSSWSRKFQYHEEKARGLDFEEDLHVPGAFQWDMGWMHSAYLEFGLTGEKPLVRERNPKIGYEKSVADFLVKRDEGLTMIAGYPWFGDWGRDTFIAMRGMLIARDCREESLSILLEWSKYVDQGMIPNRFPDRGNAPEYNSVDASLWYVVVVGEFLKKWEGSLNAAELKRLQEACLAILKGYQQGTRHGIRMEADGLIACGAEGVQLTWMDAKVGDWVVTPRIGKPVEIQALWIHALEVGMEWEKSLEKVFKLARTNFEKRFWNGSTLNDVVDCNSVSGSNDRSIRPNMLLAIGGLPKMLLNIQQAKSILKVVEKQLWTPVGLRSLSPEDSSYCGVYQGGVVERDRAYHQGTVWIWWIGPFIEAWLRVYGDSVADKQAVKKRFFDPFVKALDPLNQKQFPEIADGDAPYQARGCPFQAWSLGEVIRAEKLLES